MFSGISAEAASAAKNRTPTDINDAEVSTAAIIEVVRSQKLNVLGFVSAPDIRYQGRDNDPR
jgi:hypothetical protein